MPTTVGSTSRGGHRGHIPPTFGLGEDMIGFVPPVFKPLPFKSWSGALTLLVGLQEGAVAVADILSSTVNISN